MKLTPYKKEKLIANTSYKRSAILALLEEFAEGDLDCVKIEDWYHKTAYSCYATFVNAIKRYNMTGISCHTNNGEVFLIKETAK